MNSNQITERMEHLIDPTLVISEHFGEDELFEKCQMWENIRELTFKSMQDTIVTSLNDKTLKVIADSQIGKKIMDSETIEPVVKTMVKRITENARDSVYEMVWDDVGDYVDDRVIECLEGFAYRSVVDSSYIHLYSKFTPDEFSSFLETLNDMKKEQVISVHARFNDMDWFWKNGLCCFRSFIKGEYYVCSYNDPKYYRKIKGIDCFE